MASLRRTGGTPPTPTRGAIGSTPGGYAAISAYTCAAATTGIHPGEQAMSLHAVKSEFSKHSHADIPDAKCRCHDDNHAIASFRRQRADALR